MEAKLINNGRIKLSEKDISIFGASEHGDYTVPYKNIDCVSMVYTDTGIGHMTVKLKEKGVQFPNGDSLPVDELTLYFEMSEKRSIEKLNRELCKKVTEFEVNLNDVGESVINRLYKLHNLKENGIIDEKEFIKKRNQIIESASTSDVLNNNQLKLS